ncbi:MAG: glycosyltransferase family 9 protein [Sedimentisphaerales bacterium]|nr:glycosyltransferase family 9 protein [Sedimentisphaerales bacterium]
MQTHDNILDMLREKGAEAARKMQRGLIVQPGAIGDCILTLPLAAFMKETLQLGAIDLLGHTEYVGYLPGRSCIDGVHSIDSLDLHRLYATTDTFELEDRDALISAFSTYAWIATFLGEPDSNFEQNLIYTANCSHSAEVITLSMKPPKDSFEHLADFYFQQFVEQSGLPVSLRPAQTGDCLISATDADVDMGRELLKEAGFESGSKLVVIQPGSGGTEKCWCLDNFLTIAEELITHGIDVLFLLGPAELERFSDTTIHNKISRIANVLSDLSLTQVLGLLSCADGFIGNDSGITHLAATMGITTLVVFGPTNPAVYKPIGPSVIVFSSSSKTFTQKPTTSLQHKLVEALIN